MTRLVFVLIFLGFAYTHYGQDVSSNDLRRPLNNVGVNLLGDASIISFNYERVFHQRDKILMTGKLGIGYTEEFRWCFGFSPCGASDNYLTLPHHITGNLGKRRGLFEFGLGATLISGSHSSSYIAYPIIGYRLHPLRVKKMNFRAYINIPFTGLETSDIIISPLGINGGYSF